MNKLIKSFAVFGAVASAVVGSLWLAQPVAAGCSDFNVVRCGTPNHQALKNTYNTSASIKALYNQFGITDSMINGANMQEGVVDVNGNITVGGRVVATGARTLQAKAGTRQRAPEAQRTAGGRTFYQYPTGDSFILGRTHFAIYAWFDANGKFIAGIVKDCGNPVWGTPTPPPAKPAFTCDALKVEKVSRNSFKFTTTASAKNGATITGYTYDFGDGTKANGGTTVNHTYAKEGTYTIKVTVTGTEGSTSTQKTSQACQVVVKVSPEPTIQVCELSTNTIVTIKESQFDTSKHSKNLKDCDKIKVCDLSSGAIVTIKEKDFDEKKYSKNVADCEKIKVCRISDKTIVEVMKKDMTSDHTTDMSKCEETPPTTVVELPHTGIGNVLLQLAGVGTLAAAGGYYYIRRKQ